MPDLAAENDCLALMWAFAAQFKGKTLRKVALRNISAERRLEVNRVRKTETAILQGTCQIFPSVDMHQ